ncbi:MAG: hypothetical protein WAO55_15195 [Candidatus Manganitrophaceae bacterium]
MPTAQTDHPLVPAVQISVNGTPLPFEAEAHLTEVMVEEDVGLPGMFTLGLAGSDALGEETAWVDRQDLFSVGFEVEIKMGYAESLESLFVGEIIAIEPEYRFDRLPFLTVRGYDRRHRLHRSRKTRTFLKKKDSGIAGEIAGDAGLTAKATDTKVIHDYVLQANQTDMEFLQERARRIEYEVVVENKTLFFRPVPIDKKQAATLSFQDDLVAFYPRLSSARPLSEVTVRGWDPKQKKEIVGKAKKGNETSKMGGKKTGPEMGQSAFGAAVGVVSDRPVMTQGESDQMALAWFNHAALAFITGEGLCRGRTDLRGGKVIQLDGLGKRFSGLYYITTAVHQYTSRGGYETRFTVRRNAS